MVVFYGFLAIVLFIACLGTVGEQQYGRFVIVLAGLIACIVMMHRTKDDL